MISLRIIRNVSLSSLSFSHNFHSKAQISHIFSFHDLTLRDKFQFLQPLPVQKLWLFISIWKKVEWHITQELIEKWVPTAYDECTKRCAKIFFQILCYDLCVIIVTAMVKEKGEAPYTLYTINVARVDTKGQQEIWDVYRRFSEFHDLHMCLTEKFESLKGLSLPSKRAFNNTSKSFVQKRIKALNAYIQVRFVVKEMGLTDDLKSTIAC